MLYNGVAASVLAAITTCCFLSSRLHADCRAELLLLVRVLLDLQPCTKLVPHIALDGEVPAAY